MEQITVKAVWDDEAKVWVAESDDVPGLITEAPSPDALSTKLAILIPELLEANHALPSDQKFVNIRVQFHGEHIATLQVAA
ncbi:MAG: DUF1902 domain-containing protein [Candidatus Binatia bacterium]